MVCVCAVVVAEDQLSCCGCYAVAHIVAVLPPDMKFVCMSECLGVGHWWRSLLKAVT